MGIALSYLPSIIGNGILKRKRQSEISYQENEQVFNVQHESPKRGLGWMKWDFGIDLVRFEVS